MISSSESPAGTLYGPRVTFVERLLLGDLHRLPHAGEHALGDLPRS